MRYLGRGGQHPAVEQFPGIDPHAHAAVFDEHLAARLAQRRPARLIIQLGVAHLEIQAQGARFGRGALVQCALVLEIALLDAAGADRLLQPFGQRRTERRTAGGQVLAGEAGIAVAQPDAQIHVVLGLRIVAQTDQEIAGDVAFLADHAQIRRPQADRLVVELPDQPGLRLAVAPGFGEQLLQVQGERIAVQAQFALAQIALNTAVDPFGRRRTVVGGKRHAGQIGRVTQSFSRLGLRSVGQLQIAQHTARLQRIQHLGGLLRQRRQGAHALGQGR